MLFEPATRMRWRVEQPASVIIGSTILSPVATGGADIASPVFRSFSTVGRGPEPCGNRSFCEAARLPCRRFPLLKKDKTAPPEFTRSAGHLPGKHPPTAARASEERPGVPIAQLTCLCRSARGNFANEAFALFGGQDDGLLCIYRGATRPNHWRGSTGLYR